MCKEKCHKGKNPKDCTPEQIRECHGDVREAVHEVTAERSEHPCEKQGCTKKQSSGK